MSLLLVGVPTLIRIDYNTNTEKEYYPLHNTARSLAIMCGYFYQCIFDMSLNICTTFYISVFNFKHNNYVGITNIVKCK
jgi:hypothetical protein